MLFEFHSLFANPPNLLLFILLTKVTVFFIPSHFIWNSLPSLDALYNNLIALIFLFNFSLIPTDTS